MNRIRVARSRIFVGLFCLLLSVCVAIDARANEIWVVPTLQTDTGGLGVGNGIWPVSPQGVTRLVLAIPDDLQTFQGAKIVLIPSAPAGAGVLHVHICTAENSDMVGASCSGPVNQPFTGIVNRLIEVDVTAALAPHVTDPGARYLAIAAYTTPTFTTDHIAGLRFAYAPTPPAGVATLGANTFTGTQSAPTFAGDGSALTNVSANLLDGIDSSAFALATHGHDVSQVTNAARLTGGNTFTGFQTFDAGNLDLDPSTAASGNLTKNGLPFLHNYGVDNTFLGLSAGNFSLTGQNNTALGRLALGSVTDASENTAVGSNALRNNTTGFGNTAHGSISLFSNTTGQFNTAVGFSSLPNNTTGSNNTAVGSATMNANTTGADNTAQGSGALNQNTAGQGNTASGTNALAVNVGGNDNTAHGKSALFTTTGSRNVGIGSGAGSSAGTGSDNIYLGTSVSGVSGESNTMYLGRVGTQTKTVIAGVRGTAVTGGEMVVIDANGRLGSTAAVLTPGANSVGTNEVINDSLTSDDLAPDSVGASEVAFNYAGSASEGGAATNAELLDGIDSSAFALAAHGHDVTQVTNAARLASNIFTGTQTIDTGNLDLDDSTATTGNLTKNGTPFLHNFGANNTFVGLNAGNLTTSGFGRNTAIGVQALASITVGSTNTAVGYAALAATTNTGLNTAVGYSALTSNSGDENTAVGGVALMNSIGSFNTAVGSQALRFNTAGSQNTAVGRGALSNSLGDLNTAVGSSANAANTTGHHNTAVGQEALFANSTGSNNVAIGVNAGTNATTGLNNIYLGADVQGIAGESNTMYLGRVGTQTTTLIAGVRGTAVAGGEMVVIDANGRLGSTAAALTPGANSVGTNEVINDSLTSDDLAPDSVGASEVAFNYAGSASEGGAASNSDLLDGIDSSAFALAAHGHDVTQVTNAARLTGGNTFTGLQTLDAGNIDQDDSTATTGNIMKNGTRFLHNFGGAENTFVGWNAGNFTMSGGFGPNTGLGSFTLFGNTSGYNNSAVGGYALYTNTTGFQNTAVGQASLFNHTTGSNNVALGTSAGHNATTGMFNIYLGAFVDGVADESFTMYLGKVGWQQKTVIAGVRGTAVTGGEMVVIDANGRLGSTAAALTPGANSVGTNEVINDSLTSDDLAPDSVGASEVAFNYAGSASEGGAATNSDLLDGIDSSAFALAAHGHDVTQVTNAARLTGGNTLTGLQTLDAGNLDLDDSTSTTGTIAKNGTRFLHNFGTFNVFLGREAGNFTMTGAQNVASGTFALNKNTTGGLNVGLGHGTLFNNTDGNNNIAIGNVALQLNTTGGGNLAVGTNALSNNSTGNNNTASGTFGLYNTTGSNNVGLGVNAGLNATFGSNNIYIGALVQGVAGESNTMYLGKVGTQTKTVIAGVRGITTGVADAIPVVIDSTGQLGTISSSRRFKEDINDMPASLNDRLLRLRPVTFRYTQAYADGSKPIQYGLVAEEVAEVFPELAVRNSAGEVETVHYETLNVLLLKQFQEQQAILAKQQSELDQLKQQMKDLIQSQNQGR